MKQNINKTLDHDQNKECKNVIVISGKTSA